MTTKDGIDVHCAHDEIVQTNSLKPRPNNPNMHPQDQIELLAKIISVTGWRMPIVVSTRSGLMTKGHGRLLAAKHMKWSEVPVDRQDYASDELEFADVLADNQIAELSSLDLTLAKDMIELVDTGAVDLQLTGFDTETLHALMASTSPPPPPDPEDEEPDVKAFRILCRNDEQMNEVKKIFGASGTKIECDLAIDTLRLLQ